MRLHQLLTEEYTRGERGVMIDKDQALKILQTKCSDSWGHYLKTDRSILRGMDDMGGYYLIDPSKHTRISRNTSNYYTIIVDGHPAWKSYPKRSKSIICTTWFPKARDYGTAYHVFPVNGSNIAVCPSRDFWYSFPEMKMVRAMSGFNNDLADIFDLNGIGGDNGGIDIEKVTTYQQMMDNAEIVSYDLFDQYEEDAMPDQYMGNSVFKSWDKKTPFDKWLKKVLDPKANGFFHTKSISKALSVTDSREMWTDGESLLINDGDIEELKG